MRNGVKKMNAVLWITIAAVFICGLSSILQKPKK